MIGGSAGAAAPGQGQAVATTTPSAPPGADRCRNCDASLAGLAAPAYCPRCGQETTLHAPTFVEFAHEFAGHFVAVEGTLWRTLKALVAAPGKLTTEYFEGRRRRYVAPLRLFLSASFVFFLVVKVFDTAGTFVVVAPLSGDGRPITVANDPATYSEVAARLRRCTDTPGACSALGAASARVGLKALALSAHPRELSERIVAMASYAVFVLLPVFAALTMLVYRSRHVAYGAHFVFALHTLAFWFLVLVVVSPLPEGTEFVAMLAIGVYTFMAMRRVYGGRRWTTLVRFVALGLAYALTLIVAAVVLSVASVVTA